MRNSRSRARKLAAAGMLGGLLLAPTVLTSGPGLGFLPAAATGLGSSPLPVAGDILRMLTGSDDPRGEDLGVSGRLPEADTLSPDLLAALAEPSSLSTQAGPLASVPPGPLGIPGIVLEAYQNAANRTGAENPRCGVGWPVLAAIGRIESGHARGGRVDAKGTTLSPILGPQLSGGPGIAAISDSDGGRFDSDSTWDRAVGPMQFIPATWIRYAADGNSDGIADPHNVFDSTLAAARYLCAGGGDLRDPAALARAIFRYNHSETYVRDVLALAAAYAAGVTPLPPTTDGQVAAQAPIVQAAPSDLPPGTTPPITTSPSDPTVPSSETTSSPSEITTPTGSPTPEPTSPSSSVSETTPPPTTTSDTCATTTPTTTTETTTATTTSAPPGCPVEASASEEPTASPQETTTSMPAT